jgi:ribosomal protein L37E
VQTNILGEPVNTPNVQTHKPCPNCGEEVYLNIQSEYRCSVCGFVEKLYKEYGKGGGKNDDTGI